MIEPLLGLSPSCIVHFLLWWKPLVLGVAPLVVPKLVASAAPYVDYLERLHGCSTSCDAGITMVALGEAVHEHILNCSRHLLQAESTIAIMCIPHA